jgi:hypothetical protein
MATVAGIKIKVKPKKESVKITSVSIRENAKRDLSPKWDGAELLSATEFISKFREAMKYYRMESSSKELKPKVIDWMGRNGYGRDEIAKFKKTKDWRCDLTMGAIASCLIKGMPDMVQGFNQNRSAAEWLKEQIVTVVEAGKWDVEVVVETKATKAAAPVMNIQDRIREQAAGMSDEIDAAIDSWITDPEAFDPKSFKMVSLLRGKGAKAAQARYIKGFFANGLAELHELASGKADAQLKEAYSHNSRKNVKKLIEFYESVAQACDQIAAEAKVMKKPRATKVKPAEDLVKKIKFKMTDDKLGVTSVPAAGLIGAQGAIVYNVNTRKIGLYIAKTSAGLSVKGASIVDFTEKSMQKTLRKPAEQLKDLKLQNTQRRVEAWIGAIKTTDILLNGRLNADIMILRVFK